jgi:hypothetical protein
MNLFCRTEYIQQVYSPMMNVADGEDLTSQDWSGRICEDTTYLSISIILGLHNPHFSGTVRLHDLPARHSRNNTPLRHVMSTTHIFTARQLRLSFPDARFERTC